MNSKYYQRLVSSVLVALSLSSSISLKDKVANAVFESYKSGERQDIKNLIEKIEGKKNKSVEVTEGNRSSTSKIENENDKSVEESGIDLFEAEFENNKEIKKMKECYINLLNVVLQVLEHRSSKTNNSILKKSLQDSGFEAQNIKEKIKNIENWTNLEFLENFKEVSENTNILANNVRGGFWSVWTRKLWTALDNLNKNLNSFYEHNYEGIDIVLREKSNKNEFKKIDENINLNTFDIINNIYENFDCCGVPLAVYPRAFDKAKEMEVLTEHCQKAFENINNYQGFCKENNLVWKKDYSYSFNLFRFRLLLSNNSFNVNSDLCGKCNGIRWLTICSKNLSDDKFTLFFPEEEKQDKLKFAVYDHYGFELYIFANEANED